MFLIFLRLYRLFYIELLYGFVLKIAATAIAEFREIAATAIATIILLRGIFIYKFTRTI